MDWSALGKTLLTGGATVLGTLIGGPAGPAIGALVSHELGCDSTPEACSKAIQDDPNAFVKLKQLEADNKAKLTELHLTAETSRLLEVNKTYRAEIASNDGYVRRMRPTFGYTLCATIMLETIGMMGYIGWAFYRQIDMTLVLAQLQQIVMAFAALDAGAYAVLGVYVNNRTKEKLTQATGQLPAAGLIKSLLSSFTNK